MGVSGDAFAFGIDGELKINRIRLHEGLKSAFNIYLCQLVEPAEKTLRKNFKTKMEAIAGTSVGS